MNRRLNSVLFLAGATFFNILLLFFYFLTFLGVTGLFFPERVGWVAVVVWIALFLASIVSAWFTYRWVFRVLREKAHLEKYLDSHLFKGLL